MNFNKNPLEDPLNSLRPIDAMSTSSTRTRQLSASEQLYDALPTMTSLALPTETLGVQPPTPRRKKIQKLLIYMKIITAVDAVSKVGF